MTEKLKDTEIHKILNHIQEQSDKQQYLNALCSANKLQTILLKRFSDVLKGKDGRDDSKLTS